jgi:hypothetical protein
MRSCVSAVFNRESHELQKHHRPRCIVIGLWVAQVGLWVSICDCVMPHDSNLTIEVLARGLEKAKAHMETLGREFPSEISIWVAMRILLIKGSGWEVCSVVS